MSILELVTETQIFYFLLEDFAFPETMGWCGIGLCF